MSYSSINLAMISLFPSLIDGDFLGLPIFLFLPVLSSCYTTFLRYLQKILHRLTLAEYRNQHHGSRCIHGFSMSHRLCRQEQYCRKYRAVQDFFCIMTPSRTCPPASSSSRIVQLLPGRRRTYKTGSLLSYCPSMIPWQDSFVAHNPPFVPVC